jgi:serine/alanine adding enzyme
MNVLHCDGTGYDSRDSAQLEVVGCGDGDRLAWDSFVDSSSASTISHLYAWRRIIAAAYRHHSYYLIARCGKEIAGILPLIWVKSRFFSNILASMPFQDYGGIAAGHSRVAQALLSKALMLKKDCGADLLELRQRDHLISEGTPREDKSVLLLDLSPGTDNLWKGFGPKVRNQIRKAEKLGLSTQFGGSELLEEFYRVFAINMRDLGSPVHHPSFFSHIFSEFGSKAGVLLVKEGSCTMGGLICLFHKNTVTVPWASSLREFFSKCPNNLLYWDAIKIACDRGCKLFDFGRSTVGSGTYNFKLQWGAQPTGLHWQLFFKKAPPQAISLSEDPKYQMAARLWSRMPLTLTTWLGPALRKNLVN